MITQITKKIKVYYNAYKLNGLSQTVELNQLNTSTHFNYKQINF